LFLQGQIREAQGELRRAHALYDQLRNESPLSRWTSAARKAQARLRADHPELFGFHTTQSLADEADRLARERQADEAARLYQKLLNTVTEPDRRLKFLTKLSALYLSVRNRNAAMPLLEQIAREYPETVEAPKALYQIGNILWNRHENAEALEYFNRIIENYPSSLDAERARFAAADIHEFFGRKERAVEFYTAAVNQSAELSVRDDAAWRLAWLYYRAGEMAAAAETFKTLARQAKSDTLAKAALYWQARSAERAGDEDTAKQLYRRIFFDSGESYYEGLARRGLERLGATIDAQKPGPPQTSEEPDPALTAEVDFHLSRARELATLSLHQLAVAELDYINNTKPNGRMRAVLMREYFNNRAYGRSLTLANQAPLSQGERDLYRYPLAFWDLIQQKSLERELDPYLILALIRQESLFDSRARSSASALGLMQLIPGTAARVARQLGVAVPSQEKLFEPEVNLTLGTQYLKDLLERYSHNWHKAIAAYNAGEAAVDRWEREIPAEDIEEFVEQIPYGETRGYVKLVLRNHGIYKRLYEQNDAQCSSFDRNYGGCLHCARQCR
ncbi:MAG TPA: transglycosylase SLT domain-containing protein, partial [Candidatus Binatia bacterium]